MTVWVKNKWIYKSNQLLELEVFTVPLMGCCFMIVVVVARAGAVLFPVMGIEIIYFHSQK